jgi:teichuronic acid biosynthesis glycosyltransferase TuaH
VLPAGRRLVVATTPLSVPLARRVRAERRALDGMGDWRALGSVRHLRARVDEGYRAARSFDAVTAVSDGLAGAFRELGLDATVVGNGVDVAAFDVPPRRPAGIPDSPFAVYVGAIEDRVDLDLLDAVADRGVTTVVAGPATGPAADRLRAGRLHWLGPVPTDDVPALLRAAAVGLVPHVVGPLTASMDPMKVLEYAAAGLPIVATAVPMPAVLASAVSVVDASGFADAVVAALERGKPSPAPLMDRDWTHVAAALAEEYLGRAEV